MELIITNRKGEKFTVLYDDEDHELLSKYKWCIDNGYVASMTNGNPKKIKMHRLILGVRETKQLVDHKNHNPLDNRKCNIRLCSRSENGRNRRPCGKSKYLGVSVLKKNSNNILFRAQINICGKTKFLGVFHIEEDAAKAYDNAARIYHGDFANPNIKD